MPTSRAHPDYFWGLLAASFCLYVASVTSALAAPVPAGASNAVISINVNTEPKGEFVVWVTADGKYLIKVSDLVSAGIKSPKGDSVDIDGENFLLLQSLQQATVKLDEKTQTFNIQSSPEALGKNVINLLPKQHSNVDIPKNDSVFFNYRTGFSGGGDTPNTFSFTHELGLWRGDYLFLTDGNYTASKLEKQFIRNMSSMIYDKRELFQRVIVGDFFTTTGEFGSALNLGGVNVAKLYSLQPNFVKSPMASFVGGAALPSEVDIYLNGNRIRTEKIPPGEFELQNLNYFGGARDVKAVVKDKLGREQTIDYRYYFSDDVLQKDLHEYNYGLGMLRKDFGVKSFAYENVGFSAFHRYGYSDNLTVGGRGEFLAKKFNAGPFLTYRLKQAGIISTSLSLSRALDENAVAKSGNAMALRYAYQSGSFIGNLGARRYSRHYSPASGFFTLDRPQLETVLSAGYGTGELGNIGIAINGFKKYVGDSKSFTTLSYARALSGKANIFANYSTGSERNKGAEIFIGFAYYPYLDYSASVFHQKRSESGGFNVIEGGKNVPAGEGLGYRVTLERSPTLSAISPSMQYNTRSGFATAELRTQTLNAKKTTSYQLAFSGAALGVDDQYGFSRPVNDSFGFVHLDGLPDVRIYQNNQEVGKTDAKGNLFLPYIGSFVENQISLNDKDIPIDYSIKDVNKYISPNYRSGNMVIFSTTRIQATTGHLKIAINKAAEAAEYIELNLQLGGKTTTLSTGRRGQFYAENLAPGIYQATFAYKNHACAFELVIPTSNEMLIDLKEVLCETTH
jgi:outer membrane usher protein